MQKATLFEAHFPGIPTLQQREAFRQLAVFLDAHTPYPCFILKGYAGTGKTTMISTLVNVLPKKYMRSVLLAPTGRAAKVISSYSGKRAYTIHKKIYRKKVAATPDLDFTIAENKHTNTIFVVDEASMISNEPSFSNGSLLKDLINYVYKGENCRLVLVGDMAQLPPVGLVESPALSPKVLTDDFDLTVYHCELNEVVRQEQSSGILHNATLIRKQIKDREKGNQLLSYPKLVIKPFKDIFRMTGEHLEEGLHYAYQKYGIENTLIICRSNKNANQYNLHIRNRILFREEELTGGDHIMIVRNNYYWSTQKNENQQFIANGDMAKVLRVRNIHEQYGFRFADVVLEFTDGYEMEPLACRILMDTLYMEAPNLPHEAHTRLFEAIQEDYMHIGNKRERLMAIKEDPYYNALQIKFSMAVTCHKAQGGQWDAVFVDQGYITEETLNMEFMRWLYTACTRATQELFLLNFSAHFFK